MAIRITIEHPSQVVPSLREHYVRQPDGSYELDCIGGLKSALKRERAFRVEMWRLSHDKPNLRAKILEIEKSIATA